jgi:acetyltransferase-like isoleucine patch superfamily enzyme
MREWINRLWRLFASPRMLYGWRRGDGVWLAHTRISSATQVESPETLDIADHVYVGPFNLVDASGGLSIGEGCQITTHCALLTHSSHIALRLTGRRYFGHPEPTGFRRAPTSIGAYSFIGAHSVVMPGSRIGRGAIVRAFSYVDGEVPDFAIVAGQPALPIGDTRRVDAAWLERHPECRADYEAWARR